MGRGFRKAARAVDGHVLVNLDRPATVTSASSLKRS